LDCGASYEQPNKCQELGAQGYRQACRAPGASVWNEVWCRSGSQPDRKRGCGACAVGSEDRSTSLVALGLMLAGALAWGARRR
jgi:MYXO-CTERM domain-containing protein